MRILDIGSKNWFYATGEYRFFDEFCKDFILDGVEIDAHIDIYTLQGELIHSTNATRIDISNFDSGIYILKSGSKTTKLIKQ